MVVLLSLVGCTAPVVREPKPDSLRAPAAPEAAASVEPSDASATNLVVPRPGEQIVEISSLPVGARILVNNQPMGRAPLRLVLRVKPQGFCADYVSVKARFLAEDADHVSQTVEVQLTPLEKAPAKLVFTPEGAQRRIQD
jgi:hypothetical protein